MSNDELDRILSAEDDIIPSSGFASSVMDTVRCEAAALPPIPFPWKRALPGFALWAIAFILIIGFAVSEIAAQKSVLPDRASIALDHFGTGWILLALLVSAGSVALTRMRIRN